jgi:hypothetical protein
MAAKRTKTKKKPMTLGDFATAIQRDLSSLRNDMTVGFSTVREEMATKDDLYALSQKMVTREEFRNLQSDVKMITEAMVSKADLAETLRRELEASPFAKKADVNELRERVLRIEKKLSSKPTRRTA